MLGRRLGSNALVGRSLLLRKLRVFVGLSGRPSILSLSLSISKIYFYDIYKYI